MPKIFISPLAFTGPCETTSSLKILIGVDLKFNIISGVKISTNIINRSLFKIIFLILRIKDGLDRSSEATSNLKINFKDA